MKKMWLFFGWLLTLSVSAQKSPHNFEVAKQLDIFNVLYKELDLYYVDTLDARKNIDNAILYMLDRLDPYTVYYPEDKTDELKQMTTGKYAGIGSVISFREKEDRCIIADPYEGMPAAEAGVRRGDIILAIDGKDVGTCGKQDRGSYSSAVSAALRGEPGTTFELRVRRPTSGRTLNFKLTRRSVALPSVTFSGIVADSIGYVLLNGYTEDTSRDLRLTIADLKQRGARRLVLDLRSNPGGLMMEAVNVTGFFIPRGKEVLSTKGKVKEMNAVYKTQSDPLDPHIPLAVLVDGGTASSAEITSGALQDYDRAVIIGQRTYGKGLVQQPRELPYKGMLKLTTSKYYIPSGRCIQAYDFKDGRPQHVPDSLARDFLTAAGRTVRDGGGITPDIQVTPDSLSGLIDYLAASDALFDYCVNYRNKHERIAPPANFRLTDAEYEDFKRFLKESGFTYDRQSRRVLDMLRRVAAREGYAEEAGPELDALEAKLVHNEDYDLERWKKQIKELIEATIIANYYYERGVAEYNLRHDKELDEAVKVLNDDRRYRKLLSGVPEP